MLALRLGLSIGSPRPMGVWNPADESSLEAWYQNKVGITLNGSDVSQWADSSTNSHTMVQATATEQPAYNASSGTLTFDATDFNNLQTSTQISLDDEFTIGFIASPDSYNGTILGDNTINNELFKYSTSDKFVIKIDGSSKTFSLNSGTWGDDYILITRNDAGLIEFYQNGTLQDDTETLEGTADIDAIGIRNSDVNPYDGTLKEIQIYTSESAALTSNVNSYLAGL
jgi:hypothetical protein